ncbi:MAG: hypothetical protein RL764_2076, partial [Pseudomonadota bacterium]
GAGAKDGNAKGTQAVRQAIDQGGFWANHHQLNALDASKGNHRFMVGHLQVHAAGMGGNAGVAGACIKCIAIR